MKRATLRQEEEAKDAMHEVFIKASQHLSEFRGEASPLTWLYRIALNLVTSQHRHDFALKRGGASAKAAHTSSIGAGRMGRARAGR